MKLTPQHNVEAIARRKNGEVIIGRHCEGCGERHDPDSAPLAGARYPVGKRWLCGPCMISTAGATP